MSLHKTGTLVMDQEVNSNSKMQAWGKLVPISQGLSTVQISTDSFTIGRNAECTLQIQDKRLSGKHCQIIKFQNKVSITDLSTNGTYLADKKIGKNKTQQLKDNNQIWILPSSRVSPTQTLGYKIQFLFERKMKDQQEQKAKQQQKQKARQQQRQKQELQKKEKQEKSKKEEEQKAKKQQEIKQQENKKKEQQNKTDSLASKLKEQITCTFCFQIMYIPVSVQPCNHRFCGACLTDLIEAKKQQCINCRKDITTAVRDSIFNSIIEDYLKSHPEEKRSDKQQQEARNKNIFGHDPINITERIHGKKVAKSKAIIDPPSKARKTRTARLARTGSDLSASDDQSSDRKCRQCVHERNGFKCTSTQIHVQCHTCAKLMANRQDPQLHQYCVICTTNFCNLYFPPCARTGVKLDLIKNKKAGVKIDAQLLRGNKFQYEALKNHLVSKKQSSKDVFDFMLKEIQNKKFSYLFDRKIMKIPPLVSKQVPLTPDSAVCDLCWQDLWFQMVFAYRIAKSSEFPTAIRDRPQCYWGINCRTMDHNVDHAKRYNHFLYQTRFS